MRSALQSHWPYVVLLLIVASSLLASIFQAGMFTGHDIWHQVARFYHYSESVNLGLLPPGWVANLAQGYGYPLFFFSYHLPWLVGLPFSWFGLSVFSTIKVVFFLGFVLSGLAMYYSAYQLTKDRLAAFAASCVYLIAPHHFFSIFVSASIGTVYQFVFAPLIFIFIYQLIFEKEKKNPSVLLALSVGGSILSHLMVFFFIAPLLVIYTVSLLLLKKNAVFSTILQLCLSGLLALGLIAFYLVPTITLLPQIQAVNSSEAFGQIYQTNFVNFSQLVYSKWGYSPITSNAKDGEISFQVGIIQWMVVVASGSLFLLLLLKKQTAPVSILLEKTFKKLSATQVWLISTYFLLFWLAIFLMLDPSRPVWQVITKFVSLDYPFRYLLITVVSASFLFALLVSILKTSTLKISVLVAALIIAGYTNRNHIHFNMFTDFPLEIYVRSETTTNTFHEYLPKMADDGLLSETAAIDQPGVEINQIDLTTKGWTGQISVKDDQAVLIHQFDFPGQTVFVDHQLVSHTTGEHGLISIYLPSGSHLVKTEYQQSLLFILTDAFSVFALIYCGLILIRKGSDT